MKSAADTVLDVLPDRVVARPDPAVDRTKEPVIYVPDDHPMAVEMLKYAHSAKLPRRMVVATSHDGQRYRLLPHAPAAQKPRVQRDSARRLSTTRAASKSRKARRGYR